jgi:oligopeptide/dipeptide ABC transporter ATP-binding protein
MGRLLEPDAVSAPLVEVEGVAKHFRGKEGRILKAVDHVSLHLPAGETLGIVGESGSGKSTLGRLMLGLYPPTAGRVRFEGIDLAGLSPTAMRRLRRHMQPIFQDPYASLDPRFTVGASIAEPLVIHGIGDRSERLRRVAAVLETVGLEAEAARRYPHEFSGGQRQRIGIARAIAPEPKLIVADEPVSALDVSIQSQILNLLIELKAKLNLSYVFISHDLAVVEHISDRVAVMYLGRVVELAETRALYRRAAHPYTQALVSAIPEPDAERRRERIILSGDAPNPEEPPPGCPFHPRCPQVMPHCRTIAPPRAELGDAVSPHPVVCHLYGPAPANAR